jgi:hypothetical protein
MGAAGAARIANWDYEADVRGLKAALEHVTGSRRRVTDPKKGTQP